MANSGLRHVHILESDKVGSKMRNTAILGNATLKSKLFSSYGFMPADVGPSKHFREQYGKPGRHASTVPAITSHVYCEKCRVHLFLHKDGKCLCAFKTNKQKNRENVCQFLHG